MRDTTNGRRERQLVGLFKIIAVGDGCGKIAGKNSNRAGHIGADGRNARCQQSRKGEKCAAAGHRIDNAGKKGAPCQYQVKIVLIKQWESASVSPSLILALEERAPSGDNIVVAIIQGVNRGGKRGQKGLLAGQIGADLFFD